MGVKVDWRKLRDMILEKGRIFAIYVGVSNNYFIPRENEEMMNLGFTIVVCPKSFYNNNPEKLEDTVDITIIKHGISHLCFEEIKSVVLVGDDRHLGHLATEVIKSGKKLYIIGSEQVSQTLKDIMGDNPIEMIPTIKNK